VEIINADHGNGINRTLPNLVASKESGLIGLRDADRTGSPDILSAPKSMNRSLEAWSGPGAARRFRSFRVAKTPVSDCPFIMFGIAHQNECTRRVTPTLRHGWGVICAMPVDGLHFRQSASSLVKARLAIGNTLGETTHLALRQFQQ